MLEIEQKFRVPDHAAVRAALARLGAKPAGIEAEEDLYFNAPDRDFAQTGEAFRLRRVGPSNRFTYKGPKQPGPVKTRVEVELAVAGGDAGAATATALLAGLGYRWVACVRKSRELFTLIDYGDYPGDVTVCLDTAERLGTFVEVEVVADERTTGTAQQAVQAVAAELGLTDPEPRSYLRMLLEAGG